MMTKKQAEEMPIEELLNSTDDEVESQEAGEIVAERVATWLATRGFLNQFIDEKGEITWQLHPKYSTMSKKKIDKLVAKWKKEEKRRRGGEER